MSVPNDPEENPQPDVDVTVGDTPLVGDAPPSEGTDVDVTVSPTTALEELRSVVSQFHTAAAWATTFLGFDAMSRVSWPMRTVGFSTTGSDPRSLDY